MTEPERITSLDLELGPGARVYEHGWQSWSVSSTWRVGEEPSRSSTRDANVMNCRGDAPPRRGSFQGEGLLAIRAEADGPVHLLAGSDPTAPVASIVAIPSADRRRLAIRSDLPVEHRVDDGPGGIDGALARWADRFAATAGIVPAMIRPAPTAWCSWYHYFRAVTEADVLENLETMATLDLPIEVVQIDDGYQSEIGDWLTLSDRFDSLESIVRRIRDAGRRAGIWVAPFIAGERSELARRHPEWLAGEPGRPIDAGMNWGQRVLALDTTHPGADARLREVFGALVSMGIDYFKIDFVYAGALEGRRHEPVDGVTAYRRGLATIRDAIGPEAYLLGCGAPILPTVGLVDALRISPDTGPHWEPDEGDLNRPGGRSSVVTGAGRAFQHGRFWVNDPDCIVARPTVEHREELAAHVQRFGGLRASSDRLADLDAWGLETTRRLLSSVPREPFVPS